MKYCLAISFAALLALFSACNNNQCDPDLECYSVRPDSGYVNLTITINNENQWVPIAIYEGQIDDSVLLLRDTVTDNILFYYLAADTRYSATAEYKEAQLTILAVDGDRIRTRRETNCDDLCFTVNDANINLSLKR